MNDKLIYTFVFDDFEYSIDSITQIYGTNTLLLNVTDTKDNWPFALFLNVDDDTISRKFPTTKDMCVFNKIKSIKVGSFLCYTELFFINYNNGVYHFARTKDEGTSISRIKFKFCPILFIKNIEVGD